MAENATKTKDEGAPAIKKRLLAYLKKVGVKMAQLERDAGLANAYLRNSNGAIGAEKLRDIKYALPKLNVNWLLTGQGEMEECTETKKNEQSGANPRGAFDRGKYFEYHQPAEAIGEDNDVVIENWKDVELDSVPKKYRKVFRDLVEQRHDSEELTDKISTLEKQIETLNENLRKERDKLEKELRHNSDLKDELLAMWKEKAQK